LHELFKVLYSDHNKFYPITLKSDSLPLLKRLTLNFLALNYILLFSSNYIYIFQHVNQIANFCGTTHDSAPLSVWRVTCPWDVEKKNTIYPPIYTMDILFSVLLYLLVARFFLFFYTSVHIRLKLKLQF